MNTVPLPPITRAERETEDMFFLHANVCTRCGATFETSRRSRLCAICAGPQATVRCPGCDLGHQVPVLAAHKLCKACCVDLELTASALRARLDAAQFAADEAWTRLDADLAHADATDRARYDAACEKAATWGADRWARARDAAIAKGDGLSPLLAARLAWDEAAVALDAARAAVAYGLEEVERAR